MLSARNKLSSPIAFWLAPKLILALANISIALFASNTHPSHNCNSQLTDLLATRQISGLLAPILPSGFYVKILDNFFWPFGPQFGLKIRGRGPDLPGPSPGSATVGNGHWLSFLLTMYTCQFSFLLIVILLYKSNTALVSCYQYPML